MKKNTYLLIGLILIGFIAFGLYLNIDSKNNNARDTSNSINEKIYDSESWTTEIPPSCKSFFDGCNNCNRIDDTADAACTKMACEKYEKPKCLDNQGVTNEESNSNESYDTNSWTTAIPPSCKSFFDGCNNCNRIDDTAGAACTKMACEKYEKPKCLDNKIIQCTPDSDCTLTTFLDQACCDAPSYLPISKQNKKIQDEWRYKNCDYNVPNNQPCPIIKYEQEGVPFCNQGTCDMR